jgi:hypothetical protein
MLLILDYFKQIKNYYQSFQFNHFNDIKNSLSIVENVISNNVEPFIFVISYLIICSILKSYKHYFKQLYQENINYLKFIKFLTFFHNIFLIMFSLSVNIILYDRFMILYGTINPKIILNNFIFTDTTLIDICWLFTYSKVWEFLDTFLIMLKGSDTIFLQKFHHSGAVIMWYLCTKYQTPVVLVGTFFNSFVHTIMYSYYLINLCGYKSTKYKPYITILQLIQLVVANMYGIIYYIIPNFYNNSEQLYLSVMFVMYVFVLILLFINFSIKNYIVKQKNKIE